MQTLLQEFIRNKLVTHIEPSRKGVLRGTPIGFGKIKFQVALISTLTNINLIKLAEQVGGTTHGVIRVWRSQANFKECCNTISHEFNFIIDVKLSDIASILADDFRNGKFHDHEELFEQFKDADTYNKNIINYIAERLNHYLFDFPNGQIAFYPMAYYLAKHSDSPKLIEIHNLLQKRLKENLIEDAIEVLQQPELSNEERRVVAVKLKWLL